MANTIAKNAKAALGALLAGSILATAVPVNAQNRGSYDRRYDRRHDGIDAGDVIAGAIVIGGLAAILSSANRNGRSDRYDRYDRNANYDRNYDGYDWDRHGGSREAIQRCVNAVERRGGRRDDVDVRRVTGIDRIRGGYRISGNVAVNNGGGYPGDWRENDRRGYGGRDRYDDRHDDRGRYDRGYDDRGRFSCTVRYGRVDDVDLRGI